MHRPADVCVSISPRHLVAATAAACLVPLIWATVLPTAQSGLSPEAYHSTKSNGVFRAVVVLTAPRDTTHNGRVPNSGWCATELVACTGLDSCSDLALTLPVTARPRSYRAAST